MNLLFKIALKKKQHWALMIGTFVATCFLTLSSQAEMITMGILANKEPSVSSSGLLSEIIRFLNEWIPLTGNVVALASLVIVVAIFRAVCLFWHRFSTRLVAIRVSRDLRQDYFEHIQLLPMSFYQQHPIGSLSSRVVTDAFLIAEGINATLINYFETPFTIISTLILCFLASWKLSIMIFFGFPLIVYPVIKIAQKVKKIAKQIQKNQENFSSVLIDFLAGIQTVKMFSMEAFALKKYREQNEKMAALESKSARYDVSSRPVVHTIAMLFLSGALIFGLYILDMSVAELVVYCGLLYIFYEPVKKYAEYNNLIQRGLAAAERMQDVMDIQPLIKDEKNAEDLKSFEKEIVFDHVWFRYGNEWILKDFSMTVPKGKTVAIVGPTGSGKSTLVQLLPRLYDVEKGAITIDGKPIKAFTQHSLREQISFVPQKPFLFLDTVAANISFGRPYTEASIQAAAEQAHAHEFIVKLPEQYESTLCETGKNLSGGQQQRLAIARALFKNAPILVMDEATSSLDALSEKHIKDSIKSLHGKITQIIIAHRLSTIEDADKIIFLEQGTKIAEGTKDELLLTCPQFKKMWDTMHASH